MLPGVHPPMRLKSEDQQAPFWLLTMGDMNNLLMCFFIMLVSFMLVDKSKYLKLKDDLEHLGHTGPVVESGGTRFSEDKSRSYDLPSSKESSAAETNAPRIPGRHYLAQQRLPEGTLLTIGGVEGSFAEGDWRLVPAQVEMLVAAKKRLAAVRNIIEVRGHTSGHVKDSVVVEPDGRARPISPKELEREDRMKIADHMTLSFLRAAEVKKFLMEKHPAAGDSVEIEEGRIRIGAFSYTRPVADSSNPAEGYRNRRIEVLALSELVER